LDFKKEWVKSVDFGVRCPKQEIDRILGLIKTDYSKNVACRKAHYHKTEYTIEYKQI